MKLLLTGWGAVALLTAVLIGILGPMPIIWLVAALLGMAWAAVLLFDRFTRGKRR